MLLLTLPAVGWAYVSENRSGHLHKHIRGSAWKAFLGQGSENLNPGSGHHRK